MFVNLTLLRFQYSTSPSLFCWKSFFFFCCCKGGRLKKELVCTIEGNSHRLFFKHNITVFFFCAHFRERTVTIEVSFLLYFFCVLFSFFFFLLFALVISRKE